MNFEQFQKEMSQREKHLPRGLSALELIELSLATDGSGARAAALVILSLEADNWFKFSPVELIYFDDRYRKHANNVLMGVESGDFKPSDWLKRLDIDVKDKIRLLMEKWDNLRVKR